MQDDPSNPSGSSFTVPAGQHFVITQIQAVCSGGGIELLSVGFPNSVMGPTTVFLNHSYEFPCNSTTVEFNLQPGLVVTITSAPVDAGASKNTDLPTYVRGYLTAN